MIFVLLLFVYHTTDANLIFFTPHTFYQTGIYYLRTRPAVNAKQVTLSKTDETDDQEEDANDPQEESIIPELSDEVCLSCSA